MPNFSSQKRNNMTQDRIPGLRAQTSWPQEAQEERKISSRCSEMATDGQCWPNMVPRWLEDGPKIATRPRKSVQDSPKTAQETSWRPLEPPRDPPRDAKATQETPRTHQETPKRPQWTDRRPFGRPQGAPRATQKPPKRLPRHPWRLSQTGEP